MHLDDDAYVHATSGSTAAPRGVVITYRNLLSNMRNAVGSQQHGDIMGSWLPLHHDMGLVGSPLPHFQQCQRGYSPRHTGFCMTRWDSSDRSPAPGLPTSPA